MKSSMLMFSPSIPLKVMLSSLKFLGRFGAFTLGLGMLEILVRMFWALVILVPTSSVLSTGSSLRERSFCFAIVSSSHLEMSSTLSIASSRYVALIQGLDSASS